MAEKKKKHWIKGESHSEKKDEKKGAEKEHKKPSNKDFRRKMYGEKD